MFAVIALTFVAATQQTPPAADPQFEAAVIKPYVPPPPQAGRRPVMGLQGGPRTNDPGETRYTGALSGLIVSAYQVTGSLISGPKWIDTEQFSIVAKVPAGTTREQMMAMWQDLLRDRFGMRFHREPREVPVVDLVVAKGGAKLKESPIDVPAADGPVQWTEGPDGCPVLAGGRRGSSTNILPAGYRLCAARMSMEGLASAISGFADHRVIDKTGLPAKYDFKLEFQPRPMAARSGFSAASQGTEPAATATAQEQWQSLDAALLSQLGLRLEPSKAMFQALVIDAITRVATEN